MAITVIAHLQRLDLVIDFDEPEKKLYLRMRMTLLFPQKGTTTTAHSYFNDDTPFACKLHPRGGSSLS